MKINLILTFIFTITSYTFNIYPQTKKEIKAAKVKSITVYQTTYKNNKELSWKDSYQQYDKNGRLILSINYNKNGLIKTKESYKYDNQGNKLEEIKWNNDSLIYHKKYTYNSNSYKTEEIWLDNKGKIIQKSVFKLNANGDKIVETVYNNSEQIISTIYYTYNNKKLKTERKTINAKGEIESIKKFSYEYY